MDNTVQKSKAFLSSLKNSISSNIYLFMGEEESEKERAIQRIRTIYFGKDEGEFSIFHADNGELMHAASFLLSSSIFSQKKMAVIKGFGSSSKESSNDSDHSSKKGDSSVVAEICSGDSYVVVFSTQSKICPASLKKMNSHITQVIFYPPFENDVNTYLVSELRKRNFTLNSECAHLVTSLVGRSYEKADDAIEKIVYGSKSNSPDIKELSLLLSETRETSVFEYIDALFARNKTAFALLKNVLEEGAHELQLLALVNRKLKEIERTIPAEEAEFLASVSYRTERALKSQKTQSFLSNPMVSLTASFMKIATDF